MPGWAYAAVNANTERGPIARARVKRNGYQECKTMVMVLGKR